MANLYHFKKKTHDVGNRFCLLYTEQVYAMVNLVAFGFLFIVSFASEVKNTSKCTFAAITIFTRFSAAALFKFLSVSVATANRGRGLFEGGSL